MHICKTKSVCKTLREIMAVFLFVRIKVVPSRNFFLHLASEDLKTDKRKTAVKHVSCADVELTFFPKG
jgi:hypothetical protein